jgi:hypothetical protein
MAWEVPFALKVTGWIHDWTGKKLERQRQESEATRELLRKAHELLTMWRKTYPQVVELFGVMKKAAESQKLTPEAFQGLTEATQPATAALIKNTPDLSRFIAANSLLLPEEVTARLKEIERMSDMAPMMLGRMQGESQAKALREKCDELMRLIETQYFPRKGGA